MDPIQIVAAIAKYISSFGFFAIILHLEGEEIFGSTKCKANLPFRLEVDSHLLDGVNFSCPTVANATIPIN